jgi:hypothetical protein
MAQENRLTLQDRAALITVIVLVLTTVAGFVYTLVSGTEHRVIEAIKSVDNKVEKVDAKLEKHIDFHMTNKLQCKEDVTNAEEEDTEETSTSEGFKISWGREGRTEKREEIRKQN